MHSFEDRKRSYSRFFGHVSGIVGACALLNVAKGIIDFREFIVDFIKWWQEYIRPIARFLFHWISEIWPWAWPEWGYDYLVLSVMIGFGGVRFFELLFPAVDSSMFRDSTRVQNVSSLATPSQSARSNKLYRISWNSLSKLILVFFVTFIVWPIFIIWLLCYSILIIINDGFSNSIADALFLALSPLVYFSLILIVNYALFFAGVK
jgi:hypothetical protein